MGIYFRPLLMLPFSTVETIMEEKNEIINKAAIEKYLKWLGFTVTWPMVKGRIPGIPVVNTLDTKLRITIKR